MEGPVCLTTKESTSRGVRLSLRSQPLGNIRDEPDKVASVKHGMQPWQHIHGVHHGPGVVIVGVEQLGHDDGLLHLVVSLETMVKMLAKNCVTCLDDLELWNISVIRERWRPLDMARNSLGKISSCWDESEPSWEISLSWLESWVLIVYIVWNIK